MLCNAYVDERKWFVLNRCPIEPSEVVQFPGKRIYPNAGGPFSTAHWISVQVGGVLWCEYFSNSLIDRTGWIILGTVLRWMVSFLWRNIFTDMRAERLAVVSNMRVVAGFSLSSFVCHRWLIRHLIHLLVTVGWFPPSQWNVLVVWESFKGHQCDVLE